METGGFQIVSRKKGKKKQCTEAQQHGHISSVSENNYNVASLKRKVLSAR
jgi:hypothetical protein